MMRVVSGLLLLALLALLGGSADASAKTKPDRAFANAIVQQVFVPSPNNPFFSEPFRLATVHVQLKAYDVDPIPPSCSSCQTADTGSLTITKVDPNDPRPVTEFSRPINWVWLFRPGAALVSVGDDLWTFVDGGTPGNEVVGPPLPTGLDATRDALQRSSFVSPDFVVMGSLVGGTVKID